MNEQIKSSLKQAILRALPVCQQLSELHQEPVLEWTKREDGGWQGMPAQRASLFSVFWAAEKQIQDASSDFADRFFSEYSDYGGGKLVGCAGLGSQQLAHDKSHILKKALGCLWERHETFECGESDVDAIVNEFEEFVDLPTIRIRIQTQLLNFSMAPSILQLTKSLFIRRLTEREMSKLQGGTTMRGMGFSWMSSLHEFVLECEHEGEKTLLGKMTRIVDAQQFAQEQLDKAMLCLRTFKEGYIGYDWVHFGFAKFSPLDSGSIGGMDRPVRPAVYRLSEEEVATLPEYARNIFELSESAMETACARLADAECRLRPQEQILDAVIGMETLLLAGLGKDDRKSELKYRFAMNYSTLFGSADERWTAYNVAKDFYNHRSTIAHGGDIGSGPLRIGSEKLNLHETAQRAKNTLRMIIKRFLPNAKNAPYKKSQFWEQAYFGLSEPKQIM